MIKWSTVLFPLEECLHLVVHKHFLITFPEYIVSEYVESQSSFLLFWWICGKINICQLRNAQREGCMLSFVWGKVRSADNASDSSEKLLQGGGGRNQYIWFYWRESWCNQALIFTEVFCYSWGVNISIKAFTIFLDMRRCKKWVHRISSWKFLSEELFCQFS